MQAFKELTFSYCFLIWILHSRTLNNKTNRIHKEALKTVYSDCKPSMAPLQFIEKNVQSLAFEIYNYLHGLSPAILVNVFKIPSTKQYRMI